MTFQRTANYSLIRQILTHPDIWRHIHDDSAPPAEDWRPVEDERIWYVLAWDGEELLGLFLLLPQNAVCWEAHVAMLPAARGRRAQQAIREAVPWLFQQGTLCPRLLAKIPATNQRAIAYVRRAGWEYIGTDRRSFLRNGALVDRKLFGISKE